QILYAAGRVGLLDASTGKALFELSDHLGNVRAVVAEGFSTNLAEVLSYTDYYPHGGVLPGRNYTSSLNFPYGYQGQEKDQTTGLTNFELRQYDPRIGRWYNPDPNMQHHSPYLAMSNNPVSFTDPDGGWDGDSGMTDDFAQSMQGTVDWMRMTPAERRDYQAANGTDYAGQFRDKVFDL
ncbi:UNVERIFIED_CONTAM: RHS repeat-associated core domain-containing protein, partial [Salmonella enterica subsp. enterica serovar Weltevreden]